MKIFRFSYYNKIGCFDIYTCQPQKKLVVSCFKFTNISLENLWAPEWGMRRMSRAWSRGENTVVSARRQTTKELVVVAITAILLTEGKAA